MSAILVTAAAAYSNVYKYNMYSTPASQFACTMQSPGFGFDFVEQEKRMRILYKSCSLRAMVYIMIHDELHQVAAQLDDSFAATIY